MLNQMKLLALLLIINSLISINYAYADNLNIGGLAWIEPKSRVITIGAPNIMEGAAIGELLVEEGMTVKKGQILGMFATYAKNKASRDIAKFNLDLSLANLTKVKSGNKRSDIAAQSQKVKSLKAQELSAIAEFNRMESLYNEALISKTNFDTAKANKDSIIAERKAAEDLLTSISTVRSDDLLIAESEVNVARSQLELAESNLALSVITAPIDGTIITIHARNSEAVGNNGVLDIADLSNLDAVIEVDESDILRVKIGQNAEIFVNGIKDPIKGRVREIGGQVKRNAIIDNNPSKLLDTRIIDVRIELEKTKNAELSRLINSKVRATIFP